MDSGDITTLIMLFILLFFSAFFSCCETALTTANQIRIITLVEQGNKRAALVAKLTKNPHRLLSAILVGNNIVNLSASSLATIFASKFGGMAAGIATGIVTITILIFGEITPKTIATKKPESLSMTFAPIVYFFTVVFTPLVYILNLSSHIVLRMLGIDPNSAGSTMTEHELRKIVDVSHAVGVIKIEEKEMINKVVDFGDSVAKDIMTPQIDITIANVNSSYEDLYNLFKNEQYSRVPIFENTRDNIIGVLNIKDLFFYQKHPEQFLIHDILRKPFFTYEFKKTAELLIEMRNAHMPLAIVLDEYGATAGLVTIEDLIEEIVGEIRDEYDQDELENIIKINDHEFLVSGTTKLTHIDNLLGTNLESDDFDSIAGYTINMLDHIAKEGEKVFSGNLTFIAERVIKNRIKMVRIIISNNNMEEI